MSVMLSAVDVPDRASLDELERRVQRELSGRVFDFRLTAGKGGLILNGRTNTYYAKQMAQHMIMAALECPIASNSIEVL